MDPVFFVSYIFITCDTLSYKTLHMITKTERKKLKRILKGDYTKQVLEILDSNDILNGKGEPYSASTVKAVFIGRFENRDIEAAILEVYQDRKAQLEDLKKQKSNLLSA